MPSGIEQCHILWTWALILDADDLGKKKYKIAVWLWFSIPIVKPVKLFTLLKL